MPSYVQLQGPRPDLPGSAGGLVEPSYLTYPKQLFKAVPNTPAGGGEVSIMTFTTLPPAPPVDQNAAWQAINKEVGATLQVNAVSFPDYASKFAAMMSGNDLPDMFYVVGSGASIPSFTKFLETRCADLTPYLSGDAVKDYPNLANLPSACWIGTAFGDKIYGVPIPYVPFRFVHYVHQTLLDDAGLAYPKKIDEYRAMLQALTRAQQNQWGTGAENTTAGGMTEGFPGMYFRAPNNWKVDSAGHFTKDYETDEFKAALALNVDLWKAGVFDPSSPTANIVQARGDFGNRKTAVRVDGWQPSTVQIWNTGLTLNPPSKLRILPPFAHDGGNPVFYLGSMNRSFTLIKQAPADRVKEMLRILNWFASPFGSMEYELQYYGLKDIDFVPDDKGNPQLTDRGKAETTVPWQWIAQGPLFDFDPLSGEYAQVMHAGANLLLPLGVSDPSLGLYSPTGQATGGIINQKVVDGMIDIFYGRRPLTDFDQLVTDWKTNAGDQIRGELEQAYAAAKS
jgi:putative aldouronate transport system substrate-binding protein